MSSGVTICIHLPLCLHAHGSPTGGSRVLGPRTYIHEPYYTQLLILGE